MRRQYSYRQLRDEVARLAGALRALFPAFVYVMGRTDDVINVAGHWLSTGEMEDRVARHPAVAECAAIGVPDTLKGQLPLALVLRGRPLVAAP